MVSPASVVAPVTPRVDPRDTAPDSVVVPLIVSELSVISDVLKTLLKSSPASPVAATSSVLPGDVARKMSGQSRIVIVPEVFDVA